MDMYSRNSVLSELRPSAVTLLFASETIIVLVITKLVYDQQQRSQPYNTGAFVSVPTRDHARFQNRR
jgi:hypothetical protein